MASCDSLAKCILIGAVAGAVVAFMPISATAGLVLSEDFDDGTFSHGVPASNQDGMEIAPLGSGACDHFSAGASRASGQALCGSGTADTAPLAERDDPFDEFVFSDPGLSSALRIDLSLAAFEFGLLDGPEDAPQLRDFVDIRLGGERVVHFHGVNTRTTEHDGLKLAETGGRYLGPDLLPADADDPEAGRFFDFSFYVGSGPAGQPRDLSLQIALTGSTEFAALDAISISAIPAPETFGLLGLGLVGAGLALRRRSASSI